jgi:hypothetical protein
MTSPPPPQLPLTIAERSLFDGIRIRWGGLGSFGLGVGLLFTEQAAGVVFGIVLILLGLATWILSGFGNVGWFDIPKPQRYIVGTGAVVGFLSFVVFVGGTLLVSRTIQMLARNA